MSISDARLPTASSDAVAIFSATENNTIGAQTFEDARPTFITINEPSRFMAHQLEDGTSIVDQRVLDPIEIGITFILRSDTFREIFQSIREAFRNATRFYVQTKATTYSDMYISGLPHDETIEIFDTLEIVVLFKQARFFSAQSLEFSLIDVQNDEDSSTVDRGEQNTQEASALASFADSFQSFSFFD